MMLIDLMWMMYLTAVLSFFSVIINEFYLKLYCQRLKDHFFPPLLSVSYGMICLRQYAIKFIYLLET